MWTQLQDGCNDEDPQCGSIVALKFMVKPSELVGCALLSSSVCSAASSRLLALCVPRCMYSSRRHCSICMPHWRQSYVRIDGRRCVLQEEFKSCLQKFTEKAQDEDGLIMLKFAKSEC